MFSFLEVGKGHLPNVGPEDAYAFDDSEENRRVELGCPWEANSHERTAFAEIVDGLLICGALQPILSVTVLVGNIRRY